MVSVFSVSLSGMVWCWCGEILCDFTPKCVKMWRKVIFRGEKWVKIVFWWDSHNCYFLIGFREI